MSFCRRRSRDVNLKGEQRVLSPVQMRRKRWSEPLLHAVVELIANARFGDAEFGVQEHLGSLTLIQRVVVGLLQRFQIVPKFVDARLHDHGLVDRRFVLMVGCPVVRIDGLQELVNSS